MQKQYDKPKIEAEITAITTFRGRKAINIKMIDGRVENFLTGFCTKGGFSESLKVGDKGMAQYRSGLDYGLWFFEAI